MDERQKRRYVASDGEGGLFAWASSCGRVVSHAGGTLGFLFGLLVLALLLLLAPFRWLAQELWALLEDRERPRGAPRPKSVRGGARDQA